MNIRLSRLPEPCRYWMSILFVRGNSSSAIIIYGKVSGTPCSRWHMNGIIFQFSFQCALIPHTTITNSSIFAYVDIYETELGINQCQKNNAILTFIIKYLYNDPDFNDGSIHTCLPSRAPIQWWKFHLSPSWATTLHSSSDDGNFRYSARRTVAVLHKLVLLCQIPCFGQVIATDFPLKKIKIFHSENISFYWKVEIIHDNSNH